MLASQRIPALAYLLLAPALPACGDDAASDDEATDTDCADQQPTLELTNNTGNTLQVIQFRACDMSDQSDFPLPPPGLADGESISIPFPGPGCWNLSYEGDGCTTYEAVMTEDLGCDDTYEWLADDMNHICTGG